MWKFWISTLHTGLALLPLLAQGQPRGNVIDRVVAVVGQGAILHSELAARAEQAKGAGVQLSEALICGEWRTCSMRSSWWSRGSWTA